MSAAPAAAAAARDSRRPGLGTYLALAFSALCIMLTLVLTLILQRSASGEVAASIGGRITEVARLTALRLDRGLFERYREVALLAERLGPQQDWTQVRRELDAVRASYRFYEWLGATDDRGVVRAGAGGRLEGVDMTQRPWYQRTLQGIRVGDLRAAKLLRGRDGQPMRILDVAFPLQGRGPGSLLVAAISWEWAEDIRHAVAGANARPEVEPIILSGEGVVLLGPNGLEGQKLDLRSVRRVAAGEEGYQIEEWPDGKRYLVGFSPTHGYLASPGVGWKVLMRQDLELANAPVRAMQWRVFAGGIALALLFSWLGWLTAREVTRPLLQLARDARRLEQGSVGEIGGVREYREAETLAGALNSLVANLQQNKDELAELNLGLEERVKQRTAELTAALEQARTSERRIQTIIESAEDPYFGIDLAGRITDWNSRAETVFGWAREEILGRRLVDALISPAHREELEQALQQFSRTGRAQFSGRTVERTLVDRAGREIPMELRVGLVSTGHQQFFSVFAQDISERKAVERMKDEFVSTVSHELRTPLTAIYGSLNLLKGGVAGELPAPALQLLGICHDSTERLIRLINDMLDVEKIASGRMEYRMARQSLRVLLEQALRDTEAYAANLGVGFALAAPAGDVQVVADADRIVQVCVNLLSNAAKFSPRGGTVEVTLEVRDGMARVGVVDHGPGVPAQFRNRIFQRFSQADASDTRAKGGTGLGLAICRSIVEAHHGRIDFTSEPGVRTEFFFELPAA